MMETLDFDLYVNTGRQFKAHQRIDRLGGRVQDIDQSLVYAMFELLTRLFVNVRRSINRIDCAPGRERNRSRNDCTGLPDSANDLFRRLVDQVMIVRLQLDAYDLSGHCSFVSS